MSLISTVSDYDVILQVEVYIGNATKHDHFLSLRFSAFIYNREKHSQSFFALDRGKRQL